MISTIIAKIQMGQFKINFKQKSLLCNGQRQLKTNQEEKSAEKCKIHISSVTMWMPRAHMYW